MFLNTAEVQQIKESITSTKYWGNKPKSHAVE